MKILGIISIIALVGVTATSTASEVDRVEKQKQMDIACEVARQKKLAPLKKQYTQECVTKGKDQAYCERFYSDYGDRMGSRAPLFYDIAECVAAFKYKNSYRKSN